MRTVIILTLILTLIFSLTTIQGKKSGMQREIVNTYLNIPNTIQVAWNHDQSKLATLTGEQILVWNSEDWQLLYTIPNAYVYAMAWHPSENIIAGLRGGRQEELVIWDGETGELQTAIIRQLPEEMGIVILHTLSWKPDGSSIASDSVIDTITLWDLEAGTYNTFVPSGQSIIHNITELSWSGSGMYLLSGATDGTLRVWDSRTGEGVFVVEGYKHIAWSPDEAFFAGAGFETKINVWSLESGQVEVEFTEHTNTITSIDWNSNDNVLASADVDGNLFVWEATTGTEIPLELPDVEYVRKAQWSPDGFQLAIITGEAIVIVQWSAILVHPR